MAAENHLLCNFPKCRKKLDTFAWVTSCSHIFCDDDGRKEFQKSTTCPACETNLTNKFDIVRIDLQPSEAYKSMLLAGQSPDVALEIFQKSLSFWKYQVQQEMTFQSHLNTRLKTKSTNIEQYYEQLMGKAQADIGNLKSRLSETKKEMSKMEKELRDAVNKLNEKSSQCQKLQFMYDDLKRKPLNSASHISGDDSFKPLASKHPQRYSHHSYIVRQPGSASGLRGLDRYVQDEPRVRSACTPRDFNSDVDFVLKPSLTPVTGERGEGDATAANILRIESHPPSASRTHRPARRM